VLPTPVMTITLYYHPYSTNSRKVTTSAHAMGIPLDLVVVELPKGGGRTPEYLKLNPNGKVPTMVEGNTTLWESTAIVTYLAAKKPTALFPDGARRFEVVQWLAWCDSHWSRALETVVFEKMFKAAFGLGDPVQSVIDAGLKQIHRFAPVLNAALETKPFATGSDVTVADFSMVSTLMFAEQAQLPIPEYKNIARWLERIRSMDAWKATSPF
jgi:glutathione S-transferase